MEFAENGRISHRQLYRQMILTLLAPFLLCLLGKGKIWGIGGVFGTVFAVVLLLFYVIFLIRLAPCCGDTVKAAGGFWGRFAGVFFLVYVVLAASFLLSLLGEIVPSALVTGISPKWVSLAALLVCSVGSSRGMQKRGRMAEVSGGFLLWGILLMLAVCISQGKTEYLAGLLRERDRAGEDFWRSAYLVLCGFSALGLMPFLLEDVEKQGSAGKTAVLGILTLGGILIAAELILPAVLGMGRLQREKYPVLPILAGADLPGNVLARFDILWMGFLLYSMLFAVGSLFHYGCLIAKKSHLFTGKIWIPAAAYFLSVWDISGINIRDFFGDYLAYIFVPGLLLLQMILFWSGRGRWKKRVTAAVSVLVFCLFLGGCSMAVEPEKRMYPLALGVDIREGEFVFSYAMPDLAKATGQEKGGEENRSGLEISGYDFDEIERKYNRSQSKFLDMGHLEVLVLGDSLREENRWDEVLEYLKKKPFIGEDMYVFSAEDAGEIIGWKGPDSASAGEYLTGMAENRMGRENMKMVTLREVFYGKYEREELCSLPNVWIDGENLIVGEK